MSNVGKKQSSVKNDESKLPKKKLFRIKNIISEPVINNDDIKNTVNTEIDVINPNPTINTENIKSVSSSSTSKPILKEVLISEKIKTTSNNSISSKSNEKEEQKEGSDARSSSSSSNQRINYSNEVERRTKNIGINQTNNQDKLKYYITKYFESLGKYSRNVDPEFEIKFGTKGIKPITKIDYDNVVKILKDNEYYCEFSNENELLLRCQTEFTNPKTGTKSLSSIRLEIKDIHNIKELCTTNTINSMIDNINYIQKSPVRVNDEILKSIDYNDFNFRASFNTETTYNKDVPLIRDIISNWNDSKKVFRYLNRCTFEKENDAFSLQLSIVKESHKKGFFMIPEYTILDSKVFESIPKYEIEIEINNRIAKRKYLNNYEKINDAVDAFEKDLKNIIKKVLSGLQQTNFPVSYPEQRSVIIDYLKLVKGDKFNQEKDTRAFTKNFIGPSSFTLQLSNLVNNQIINSEGNKEIINSESLLPNIRQKYTVTEKADGDRKLLYINKDGKCYLIDTNMNIQFTGVTNTILSNTLIDGEHILHDKYGKYINLYAAFDIYFLDGKDKRSHEFISNDPNLLQTNYRLTLLNAAIKNTQFSSIIKNEKKLPIKINVKEFYYQTNNLTIFDCCNKLLEKERDSLFEYNTDGLIFTPMDKSIPISIYKLSWNYSLKWKPPKYNTIDFLISTKKNSSGQDIVSSIFKDGMNFNSNNISEYKTIILRVGFDQRKDGYLNPCNDIYEDKLPVFTDGDLEDDEEYKPVPFYPTDPYDADAHLCNIKLKDEGGSKIMMTEEGDLFEDEMIVEFYYNKENDNNWKWVPLRVRYDKTSEFRSGQKNYGNSYKVANSNWHSIHYPITDEIISTGENIPNELGDDDVYYNKVDGESKTRSLRDFHNLYVKKKLIMSVSKRGDSLIDYAVGKGGDLPKWIASRLSFIMGVDVSKDNIQNRIDGVCARYLNYCKKNKDMPNGMFFHGNSSVNIKSTDAFYDDKTKQIVKALFGEGPKDQSILGKGVYKLYGVASDAFNISSIQFAIHYMFENTITLNNFLKNVSECTKINGYFIGTCYDGATIFNLLSKKSNDEPISIYEEDKKIWEIKKTYDNDTFNDDSSSIGYGIDVYQETINKVFREYLVNFNYLTQIIESYGFVLITKDEANRLGFNQGSGMFNEMFTSLENDISRNKRSVSEYGTALKMSIGEKRISFLNRYFIFKKIRNVDAQIVSRNLIKNIENEIDLNESEKQEEKLYEEYQSKQYSTEKEGVYDERTPLTPSSSAERVPIIKFKIKKIKDKKIKLN